VRHLSDGALRRLYDEPYALDEEARAHYNDCGDCRARFTAVADDARHAMALLAVPGATVDPASALTRVRAGTRPGRSSLGVLRGGWRRLTLGGLVAAGVAATLVATMAFTPLAANLVSLFQPTQVHTVQIGQGDLTGLDAFSNWGDVKWVKQPELTQAESAAEAAKISGLPAIQVDAAKLHSGLATAPVSYAAVGQASGSVTFNGNAPQKLRGSTLTVVVGPAETALYGDLGRLAQSAKSAGGTQGAGAEGASQGGAKTDSGQRGIDQARSALAQAGPILAVVEMRAPQVTSTGASVADIKSALLAQPGLSQSVRDAIQSIDNPTGNLPIPIPAGQVNAHDVRVQTSGGTVNGTAVGDNTGLGSAVIWIKNGRVYGVAGTVTEDQVLAVANGLS
jgi:hypothetical protein